MRSSPLAEVAPNELPSHSRVRAVQTGAPRDRRSLVHRWSRRCACRSCERKAHPTYLHRHRRSLDKSSPRPRPLADPLTGNRFQLWRAERNDESSDERSLDRAAGSWPSDFHRGRCRAKPIRSARLALAHIGHINQTFGHRGHVESVRIAKVEELANLRFVERIELGRVTATQVMTASGFP